jgi:hypothetical protein
MLILDPKQRIKLKEIFNHEYFKVSPHMIHKSNFPKMEDSHQYQILKEYKNLNNFAYAKNRRNSNNEEQNNKFNKNKEGEKCGNTQIVGANPYKRFVNVNGNNDDSNNKMNLNMSCNSKVLYLNNLSNENSTLRNYISNVENMSSVKPVLSYKNRHEKIKEIKEKEEYKEFSTLNKIQELEYEKENELTLSSKINEVEEIKTNNNNLEENNSVSLLNKKRIIKN